VCGGAETEPSPQIFRMRIFAPNEVVAKSRFWYFLHQYKKMKRTTGDILGVNEVGDVEWHGPMRCWRRGLQAAVPHCAARELFLLQIRERNTQVVKNFGITLKYNSRSGTHNMYKEFRDTTLTGAVEQMCTSSMHDVDGDGVYCAVGGAAVCQGVA
jgi:large subunit ribosomal protein L18Ae